VYDKCVHLREVFKMVTTRVFQNGNSQALRIPQELRTDRKEYYIQKLGETFVAYPIDDPWAPVRQVIGSFPSDFLSDREQPSWEDVSAREVL
jgi:antitoxin VapB